MTDIRDYHIDFFKNRQGRDADQSVSEVMEQFEENGYGQHVEIDQYVFEVRNFFSQNGKQYGEFAKFRVQDIPKAGEVGGAERSLDLAEQEGLIEKTSFFMTLPNRSWYFRAMGMAAGPPSWLSTSLNVPARPPASIRLWPQMPPLG
ncbi:MULTISPECIES: hypothetical protein [unclassified Thioalkalivibrio]|uniref:hypothetical protein n=1 Tax=unclassified Thioalkalivibrio TaxID=2621013 RepID=UPI0003688CBC|nr:MULTISPECIES: hypothetical protein [unclassified Thioalkalivibrio]